MKCKYLLSFILLNSMAIAVLAQGRVENFALSKGDIIEDVLFDYYDDHNFNGSVLVVEDNQIIYENTFGFADFEAREPLDGETPFYLASLAKQFTAASIIKLEEEGKLSLEDPLRKYLPLMPKVYAPIKIHHLLTHTAGVPDYMRSMGLTEDGVSNLDVYKALIKLRKLEFEPGTKYNYSNSGYVLLAMVIQVASGSTIDTYFQEKIFDRFEMDNAFVYSSMTTSKFRAKGYTSKQKIDDYRLMTVGDGGIYATTLDLYKWEQALNNGEFISKSSLEKVYSPVILKNGRSRRYGFGWEIGSNVGGKLVYHTGELAGFRTYLERQLDTNNAIIILTNNSFEEVSELRNTLVKILDGRLDRLPSNVKKK